MKNKVAFHTLGCKLNFSETSTIASSLVEKGFQRVSFEEKADIYVINTCSVTENSDKEFSQIVKNVLKINADAFIVAVGCYAQLKPEALAKVDGVDLVLGASEKFNVAAYLKNIIKKERTEVHSCEISEANIYVSSYSAGDRTRAFLKVQDGCDYKCTYCTIPLARGVSRSGSLEEILDNAENIAKKGIKEIVLTGVNIGDYGKGEFGNKKHKHTFFELIRALEAVKGIERIRISSIEPNLLTDSIIDFVSESKVFMPHFHIPLQSGSNAVLRQMKRRYPVSLYEEKVNRIKSLMPHACIGVDVIVGFPGETDACFLETYHFLNTLEASYLHVFTYSERQNTEAVNMEGIVPKDIRKKRSKMLRGLSAKKKLAFYNSRLGSTQPVLFENNNQNGYIYGFTDNYIKVKAPWNPDWVNTVRPVILDKIDDDGIVMQSQNNLAEVC